MYKFAEHHLTRGNGDAHAWQLATCTDKLSTDELSTDELSTDELSTDELSTNHGSCNQFLHKLSAALDVVIN